MHVRVGLLRYLQRVVGKQLFSFLRYTGINNLYCAFLNMYNCLYEDSPATFVLLVEIYVMYMCMPFCCSCRSCLSSTNLCGWCLYDKKCISSSDQCRVSTDWINVSSTSIISVMS